MSCMIHYVTRMHIPITFMTLTLVGLLTITAFIVKITILQHPRSINFSIEENPYISSFKESMAEHTINTITFTTSGCEINNDDYFNRRYFHINKFISYESDSKTIACNIKDCDSCHRHRRQIHEYKKPEVIRCLDSLSAKRNRRPIHIAFIGDSIIRHHFLSFLRWIPDYDRKISNNSTLFFTREAFHEDRNVKSHLLDNLQVSYYWRNLIKNNIIFDFQQWVSATSNYSQVPDFIFLGITAHHIADDTSSLQTYQNLLKNDLLPLINRSLSIYPHQEIIWLLQSPTIEQRTPSNLILKFCPYVCGNWCRNTRVVIWDSLNVIVEEYLRACALNGFERRDSSLYVNCNDFIHPGFGTISLETQLIMNHLCQKPNMLDDDDWLQ